VALGGGGRSPHGRPRRLGDLIVASGNVVHDLGSIDWSRPDGTDDWNRRFDEATQAVLRERPADAPSLVEHRDYRRAAPTPEHFVPVLYLAGLAAAASRPLDVLIEGGAYGSLSMTCFGLDARCPEGAEAGGAAPIPAASPEDANV